MDSALRCVWHLRGPSGSIPGVQPIVPDGCVEVIFNLADPFQRFSSDGSLVPQPRCLIAGQITSAQTVGPTGAIDLVGLRFHPWSAAAFLGVQADELSDQMLAVEDLDPRLAEEAPNVLADSRDPEQRTLALTRFLERRLGRTADACAPARAIVSFVGTLNAVSSVRELASSLGTSQRTLERLFSAQVGLTPKTLLRIRRIQRALRLAAERPELTWSAVAATAGFFDHSHLDAEFRRFAGCTPTEFRARERQLTDQFIDGTA